MPTNLIEINANAHRAASTLVIISIYAGSAAEFREHSNFVSGSCNGKTS
jgi:hypothetical protein